MACAAQHDGTGTWFIHGNSFGEWKARGSLLCIHGKRTPVLYVYLFIAVDALLILQLALAKASLRTFSGFFSL